MIKTDRPALRLISLALCLVSLLLPFGSFSARAAEAEPAAGEGNYMTCAVYQRANRDTVIGRLEDGTRVTVLSQRGAFYGIDCYDMKGYIPKEFVEHRDEEYYVNCIDGEKGIKTMSYVSHSQALELRSAVLALAKRQLGTPYVYGGSRPGGFDCSGFTGYVYKKQGYSLTRRACTQLGDGIIVAKEGLQVGDLVFFRTPGSQNAASHVGLYAGDGKIIHAGSKGICYADLDGDWFRDYYLCARRVIHTETAQVQQLPEVNLQRSALAPSGISGRRAG